MKKSILVIAMLLLSTQAAFADHNGADVPFCGNCVVEQNSEWNENFGQQQACKADLSIGLGLSSTYLGCTDRINPDGENHTIGSLCETDRVSGGAFVEGLCVKENRCVEELVEFVDHPSQVFIENRKVAIGEPILVRIFDPGRIRSGNVYFAEDAFIKKLNDDGSSHFLANFCNDQCIATWFNKDSKWSGFEKWDLPGIILQTTDFSSSFWDFRNPSDVEKKYWFETKVSSSELSSHLSITEPGNYAFEFVDMRGVRVISDPFTVCADINNCDLPFTFPGTCQASPEYQIPDPEPLEGTIEDGHGLPVPDLKVVLMQDGDEVETFTDEDGNYRFEADDYDQNVRLRMKFVFDAPENSNGFRHSLHDERTESSDPVFATTRELFSFNFQGKTFELDSVLNFEGIGQNNSVWHNLGNVADLDDFARTHTLIAMAYRFAEDELGVVMNFQKSLRVGLFHDSGVFYRPSENKIYIQGSLILDDSNWSDRESPDNSQWHEFAHALMYQSDIGGARSLPESRHGILEWNHLGYANPSTTDSWVEGFAVFMAAVMQEEMEYQEDPSDESWLYRVGLATTFNLEDNLKAWDSLGRREDMAVAALLWDLYDTTGTYNFRHDDDDSVSMDLEEIWELINDPEVRDMKDVYDVLVGQWDFPTIGSSYIDEIFVNHGFFVDENGDGLRQDGEEIGRAAQGTGFRTSFDLSGDGIKFLWNTIAFTPGDSIALDDQLLARWGSHHDDDFNDHSVEDLDGDGFVDLTELPFYVFPFEERRSMIEFDEEMMQLDLRDKNGGSLSEAELTIEYQYDDSAKNYTDKVVVDGDGKIALWVPDGAKAVIKAGAGNLSSGEFVLTDDQFQENLVYGGDQGVLRLNVPGSAAEIADKLRQSFIDVPTSHPNFDAIEYVKDKGIVQGYEGGEYRPDQPINRAEFTKIIMETIFGDLAGEGCFPDVAREWFAVYICSAKEREIVGGYPSGRFEPAWEISFVEAAKIIIESFDVETSGGGEWFRPYVNAMSAKNAIPTSISALDKKITRGEMAEMIYRLHAGVDDKASRDL